MQKPQERYLKWRQICDRYDRGAKTIYAKCFLEAHGETVKEKEQVAFTNPMYTAYLAEWDKAEKKKIQAEVEYDNLKTQFDALQSAIAYQREELKRGM